MPVPINLPWPCAVYTKSRDSYLFSHMCARTLGKSLPRDLSVDSLRRHRPGEVLDAALRSEFLVLVAGDVAQGVCVENAGAAGRPRFLYAGP